MLNPFFPFASVSLLSVDFIISMFSPWVTFLLASKNICCEAFLIFTLEVHWASTLSRSLSGSVSLQLLRVHLKRESKWEEMHVSCSVSIKSLLSPLLTVCVIEWLCPIHCYFIMSRAYNQREVGADIIYLSWYSVFPWVCVRVRMCVCMWLHLGGILRMAKAIV